MDPDADSGPGPGEPRHQFCHIIITQRCAGLHRRRSEIAGSEANRQDVFTAPEIVHGPITLLVSRHIKVRPEDRIEVTLVNIAPPKLLVEFARPHSQR